MRSLIPTMSLIFGGLQAFSAQSFAEAPYAGPYPGPFTVESYHHDSTIQGNWMRGQSLINGSLGYMNYCNSMAAINQQQAAAQGFSNRLQVLIYFDAKRQEERAKANQRAEVRKLQQGERDRQNYQAAQALRQKLDRAAGKITWPTVLQDSKYATKVEAIELGVSRWVAAGHVVGPHDRQALKRALKETEFLLRNNRSTIKPEQMVAARDMLQALTILLDHVELPKELETNQQLVND